jgi:hypothetical protein
MRDTPATLAALFDAGIPGMSPLCVPVTCHATAARSPEITMDVSAKLRVGECFEPACREISQFILAMKHGMNGRVLINNIVGEERHKLRQVMLPASQEVLSQLFSATLSD